MPVLAPLYTGHVWHKHQEDGVRRMLRMETEGTVCPPLEGIPGTTVLGGLQCDGMGVGKTYQALGVIKQNPKPYSLVLCPKSLIDQWVKCVQQIGSPCFIMEGGSWIPTYYDITNLSAVYITNYDILMGDKSLLINSRVWDRIILDESHRIRSYNSTLTKRVLGLRATIRWALTGTPVVNRMSDVVTQYAFLGVPHTERYKWVASYYDPLSPLLVIHRPMESIRGIVTTVPPVPVIEDHILEFRTAEEEDFYRGLQGLRDKIRYARESSIEILAKLMRLRQSSISPKIYMDALRKQDPAYDKDWTIPSTKMAALAELVENAPNGKFLVFCSFRDEMDLVQDYLRKRCGVTSEVYHGGLSTASRDDAMTRAKSPACRVFLVQIQCGGTGLNLQEFDHCILMCPWWTSALMEQAIARTVRIGQRKVVRVINLILAEEYADSLNIDRFMTNKAEHKRLMLEEFFSMCH
jgi:SNF2 family DNA or RNA helicase